jgi:hypothetical protein
MATYSGTTDFPSRSSHRTSIGLSPVENSALQQHPPAASHIGLRHISCRRDRVDISRAYRAAAWLGFVLVSCAALLPALAPRLGTRAVMAIYPPWWDRDRALDASSAVAPSLPGAAPFVVLVQGSGAAVFDRLRRSGALLILSAEAPMCSTRGKNGVISQ